MSTLNLRADPDPEARVNLFEHAANYSEVAVTRGTRRSEIWIAEKAVAGSQQWHRGSLSSASIEGYTQVSYQDFRQNVLGKAQVTARRRRFHKK